MKDKEEKRHNDLSSLGRESSKIILGYHLDDFVLCGKELLPLHLGRVLGAEACCDGPVSTKARHWLLAHLQGDDTGENISAKNRDYNELTGTYWAWNNYASIGNPDYIGIFQYDRILMLHRAASEKFEEAIKDWRAYYRHVHSGLVGIMNGQDERGDLYAPIPRSFGMPMDEYWRQQVGHDNVDKLSEIIRRMRPEYVSAFEESCRSSTEVCSTLIYCRREVFFEYCRFLFPLLEAHEKECTPMPRLHALLGGWLTAIFVRQQELHARWRVVRVPQGVICDTKRPRRNVCFQQALALSNLFVQMGHLAESFFCSQKGKLRHRLLARCSSEYTLSSRLNYMETASRCSHDASRTLLGKIQRHVLHAYVPSRAGCISPQLTSVGVGNLLFGIAAVYAHALRQGLTCRVPWHVDIVYEQLRKFLGAACCLPATPMGLLEKSTWSQPVFSYSPIPAEVRSGALAGFFQTYKYFHDHEEEIRRLYASFIAPRVQGTLGIHLRYGDYLNRGHRKFFMAPTVDYIREALQYVSPDFHRVVLFTDDCELGEYVVRKAMGKTQNRCIVEIDHSPSMHALRRLTSMEQLIISASTFAWWGAYLGRQETVVVPARWFKSADRGIDSTADLYLPHWIRIGTGDDTVKQYAQRRSAEKES